MNNNILFFNGLNNEENPLFGRRQYILGSSGITDLKNWNILRIHNELYLTSHPDLNVEYINDNSHLFVLLGIILDPFHPELSNREILLNLSKSLSFDELIENTYDLGGRWIIIYHTKNQTFVFHDASGNRQIFYTNVNDKTWCASQPHLLAKLFQINITEDDEVLNFMRSDLYTKSEHAWIGDGTFFDEIYHLLPNHFLDLNHCETKRYWPQEDFKIHNIPVEQAVELSTRILQGSIKSMSLRSHIILAVTAGFDSRILLAASRIIKDKVYYFIQEFASNKGSNDIKIPKRLLKKLKLEFHIEKCEKKIEDEDFEQLFYKNVAINQSDSKKVLHYNFYEKFQGNVYINGNVSGIAKNFYGIEKNNLTAERLAQYFRRKDDKYTIRKINAWLQDAKKTSENANLNLLNLFYWEQRMGNWGAMFSADLDIAIEVLYPFNCRTLLITLLSVDNKYRLYDNILYKELIKNMWKEALSEPINPVDFKIRIFNLINKIIKIIKNKLFID